LQYYTRLKHHSTDKRSSLFIRSFSDEKKIITFTPALQLIQEEAVGSESVLDEWELLEEVLKILDEIGSLLKKSFGEKSIQSHMLVPLIFNLQRVRFFK
jgi:hypothetical protein